MRGREGFLLKLPVFRAVLWHLLAGGGLKGHQNVSVCLKQCQALLSSVFPVMHCLHAEVNLQLKAQQYTKSSMSKKQWKVQSSDGCFILSCR